MALVCRISISFTFFLSVFLFFFGVRLFLRVGQGEIYYEIEKKRVFLLPLPASFIYSLLVGVCDIKIGK